MRVRSARGVVWLSVWLMTGSLWACSDDDAPGSEQDGGERRSGRGASSDGGGRDSGMGSRAGEGDAGDGNGRGSRDGGGTADQPGVIGRDAGGCSGSDCSDAGDAGEPSTLCTSTTLAATVADGEPGNVLLIFDRSGSMAESWNGTTRWQAAGTALQNALSPLDGGLTIGALFFPSPDPNAPAVCVDPTGIACTFSPGLVQPGGTCGVLPIAAGDQIAFGTRSEFLTALAGPAGGAPRYAPVPGGLTPLLEALQQAKTDLAAAALAGDVSVVVITDGDPNCQWNEAMALQIVSDWHAQGIDTHVIGLPGATTTATSILSDLASAGGTSVDAALDAAGLEQHLSAILAARAGNAGCTLEVNAPAARAIEVHLVVTVDGSTYEASQNYGAGSGWFLSADGSTLELTGALCAAAQQGEYEAISVELGCVALPGLLAP